LNRYICIHGHFYQPPRENPWLEAVELQDSAHPYHDWNERITEECYFPNTCARILDGQNRIIDIVNNYSRISFNFGPTLLSWMESRAPEVYRAILEADRESREIYSGHGSALAQAYNHTILPLARRRDKFTQIRWGVRDFESRFGRQPEGMWLPETAVDSESLGIMAEHGIRFTVLSPYQALRVRPIGGRAWRDVSGGRIDPSMPYRVRLRSGPPITVFFYDGPISQAVAFDGLLNRGEYLADRLEAAFSPSRNRAQLVHIATDGETYGHHHRHGEMALAYALRLLQAKHDVRLTNYGEFLELHPPTEEVEIIQRSSWSCVHGVGRWCGDCGCNSGGHDGWDQAWRAPLREALDWLRDELSLLFERQGGRLLRSPWKTRNDYICLLLDPDRDQERFLKAHNTHPLSEHDRIAALKLLEMERHCMLMYTSCGWFFDEISGLETVQILRYAARAMQLARDLSGTDLEPEFLSRLECARSNVAEFRDGRGVYEELVRGSVVDLRNVGAHYAISSLFNDYGDVTRTYAFTVYRQDSQQHTAGKTKLSVGRARVVSDVTLEHAELTYAAVRFGEQTVCGGVSRFRDEEAYRQAAADLAAAFENGDLPGLIRLMDRDFAPGGISLRYLFRDEQRRIIGWMLEESVQRAESMCRDFYAGRAPLMRFAASFGMPLPAVVRFAAEATLNAGLRYHFEQTTPDLEKIHSLLVQADKIGVTIEPNGLEPAVRAAVERTAKVFRDQPRDVEKLEMLDGIVRIACRLPFTISLVHPQNWFFQISRKNCPDLVSDSAWFSRFLALGEALSMKTPDLQN
jgi:alpha-amylase/alpha-mannosidase (GH57 family)